LAALQAEMAEATKTLDALNKQPTEAEAKLVALGNEAQRQLGIRIEAEAVMRESAVCAEFFSAVAAATMFLAAVISRLSRSASIF
jgi:hypothetical protein